MKIAMIVAMAQNNVIGINNTIPWYLPDDLRYFKAITMQKPIIMGRKTFDSLSKPLLGRTNIVITRNKNWNHENVKVVHNLHDAISLARDVAFIHKIDEIMTIGGAQIYHQFLPIAERIYLTKIYWTFKGDTFFPRIYYDEWLETTRVDKTSNNFETLDFSYLVLDKK